jgi:hypothetical protein
VRRLEAGQIRSFKKHKGIKVFLLLFLQKKKILPFVKRERKLLFPGPLKPAWQASFPLDSWAFLVTALPYSRKRVRA